VDDGADQKTLRIGDDMTLAAFDLFAGNCSPSLSGLEVFGAIFRLR
jgi:hypothetical protein